MTPSLRALLRLTVAGLALAVGAGACSKNITIAAQGDVGVPTDAAAPSATTDADSFNARTGDSGGSEASTPTYTDVCTFVNRSASMPSSGGYDLARWRIPAAVMPGTYDVTDPVAVTDTTTGLVWQSNPGQAPYDQAAADCDNHPAPGGAGGGPWRLPTRIELLSLLAWNAPSTGFPPAIWSDVNVEPTFWTATPAVGSQDQRWVVSFQGPGVGPRPHATAPSSMLQFLCVRDPHAGLAVAPTFAVATDCGIVRDASTMLEWQRDAAMLTFESTGALDAHCGALELGPKGARSGWRAPTIAELFTIVDTTRHDPALDPALFTGEVAKLASRTTVTLTGQLLAAAVQTDSGTHASLSPGDVVALRCVRDAP